MNSQTKLTPAQIEANIKTVTYTRLPSGKAIVCEITMVNGFVCHGISALVDLDNYDQDLGKQAAFNKAKSAVWDHLAFVIQEQIWTNVIESKHDELSKKYQADTNGQPLAI